MDIYLVEAMINGLLLGGVLALLALGLNLIFGVIDVVWIAYADLVMCGMYAVYWFHVYYGWPIGFACAAAILGVALLGILLHLLIIEPILGAAPINQLLATGGLLFFLQSFATLLFGTDFRNIGIRLPIIEIGNIFISYARLLAFGMALAGAVALYFFLRRTYLGTAIRAISQDREIMGLMGVNERKVYLLTSAVGGALAGLAACLLALQYDVHPFVGNTFGPLTFMICVLGGLGNMIGGFVAAFIMSQIISVGGYYASTEMAYVLAFTFFIVLVLARPRGILEPMTVRRITEILGLALLVALPLFAPTYFMHLAIQILLWGLIYTAWALMGRFGFVSLGHGAFLGIGAYVPALLWNYYALTPWIGIPIGVLLSALLAVIIGYPCFRLKVVGHYFALVTLALGQVVLLFIVAERDITGGSLGMTQKSAGYSWYAFQFPDKTHFYFIALVAWLAGLAVWRSIDRGIGREALEAISEDEEAAASMGINVLREKMRVTVISAALTACGGALFAQYLLYLNPETLSGIAVSLQIVFAAIAGGMYSLLGPTVGSLFTLALTEGLRVWFGTNFIGAANTIYGILLILFIIFMPRGILGLFETVRGKGGRPQNARTATSAPLRSAER